MVQVDLGIQVKNKSMEYIKIEGEEFWIRPETTDIRVFKEVVTNTIYRHKKIGFDVKEGEIWLDLGANIGTFSYYCRMRGASTMCFEPDKLNFELLSRNCPDMALWNKALTSENVDKLPFFRPTKDNDKYRYSMIPNSRPIGHLDNMYAGDIIDMEFDGIKMDIEGAEFGLIDNDLLPKCNKLVMEYHFSKDRLFKNFYDRIDKLKAKFDHVHYIPSIDEWHKKGLEEYPIWIDRMVYCWNDK